MSDSFSRDKKYVSRCFTKIEETYREEIIEKLGKKYKPKAKKSLLLQLRDLGHLNMDFLLDYLFGKNIQVICSVCHDKKTHPDPLTMKEILENIAIT